MLFVLASCAGILLLSVSLDLPAGPLVVMAALAGGLGAVCPLCAAGRRKRMAS